MAKILVVDDEPDVELLIRQRFAKQLKSKELEFIFASNGTEALKTLHQDKEIHVILTDINMPEMDGLVLLSHLPELKRIFKAVIISAYGDMSNIRKAMNRGACDFITKPIDFNDLEITIFNAIEQCITLKKAVEAQAVLSDLEKELIIAANIQQASIPHLVPFPTSRSFEIMGQMIPAKHVGGDFYDFFKIDSERLGFLIADVSGKGIPAALFMSMSRAIIRTVAQVASSPQECLIEANRILCLDNDACMFVTAFYGIFNIHTGEVECANAGHNPPIILRSAGEIELVMRNQGIPLGVSETSAYQLYHLNLNPNECMILYTDGITEAMNSHHELYTEERFIESIRRWKSGPLITLIDHILSDLNQFTDGASHSDDVTLLGLYKNGIQ
ncbi:MAG: SpoIIE family protein phosphatase [Parachlamydia sp.]|nr:SpoIIE family protein phosphatase [Parachlamydia sp.]